MLWSTYFSVLPLAPPLHVKMDSCNMGAILQWDAPARPHSSLTYTAKFKMLGKNTTEHIVCQSIKEHQCDFGQLPSYHGHYTCSVRTEQGGTMSKWEDLEFTIDRMTIIGPPSVTLKSKGGAIEVNIQDPVLKISSLREVYTKVSYHIRYWSKEHPEDGQNTQTMSQCRLLRPLVPNTEYCIKVQVFIHYYDIKGQDSNATCEMSSVTAAVDAEHKWSGKLVGSLLAVSVALPLLLLLLWSSFKGRRFLNPKEPLPERFKQHLCDCPAAPPPPLEKFDLVCGLCEEPRYRALTDPRGSEESPAVEDYGASQEMSGYYNIIERLVFEGPYQNTTIDI
ncbi:interleukin-10 receptor subunit beta-like isoform X2 [Hypomesus transpacificus]|uniref:interleukin-10 receptor subunit beta-like isoform X2 n=1 Tax=Hypomesus transpacificus TaxID=137520 RepID=UPI001F082F10|nr:interleukin-10 receptor subunit beta-like isoform X2 [Hypomesus transpacificus]